MLLILPVKWEQDHSQYLFKLKDSFSPPLFLSFSPHLPFPRSAPFPLPEGSGIEEWETRDWVLSPTGRSLGRCPMVLTFPEIESSLTRATEKPILYALPNNGARFSELPVSGHLPLAGRLTSPDMTSLVTSAAACDHKPRSVCHRSFCTHSQEPIWGHRMCPPLTFDSGGVRLLQCGSGLSLNCPVTLTNHSPFWASGYCPTKREICKGAFTLWLCVKIYSPTTMLKTTIGTCNLNNFGFYLAIITSN